MLMRAFAFTGRKRRILAVLMCCYTLLVGIDIWVFCTAIEILPVELYQVMALLGTKGTGCFPNYGAGFMALRIGVSPLFSSIGLDVTLTALLQYSMVLGVLFFGTLIFRLYRISSWRPCLWILYPWVLL